MRPNREFNRIAAIERQWREAAPTPRDAPSVDQERRSFWPFPGLIFAFIAMNMTIVGITVYLAVSDRSFAVEPDYYRKAVNWDATARQRQHNGQLGWTASIPGGAVGQPIVVNLRDRAGHPLSGARVEITAFPSAQAASRLQCLLSEIEPGMYRSSETLLRAGSWQVRLSATLGADTFTADVAHDVAATLNAGAHP